MDRGIRIPPEIDPVCNLTSSEYQQVLDYLNDKGRTFWGWEYNALMMGTDYRKSFAKLLRKAGVVKSPPTTQG